MPRAGATENERRTEKRSKWRGIRSARRSHGSGGPSTDAGPHRKVSFSATMTSGGKAGSPALLRPGDGLVKHGSTCALLAETPRREVVGLPRRRACGIPTSDLDANCPPRGGACRPKARPGHPPTWASTTAQKERSGHQAPSPARLTYTFHLGIPSAG
jgi:hypothetical protein